MRRQDSRLLSPGSPRATPFELLYTVSLESEELWPRKFKTSVILWMRKVKARRIKVGLKNLSFLMLGLVFFSFCQVATAPYFNLSLC